MLDAESDRRERILDLVRDLPRHLAPREHALRARELRHVVEREHGTGTADRAAPDVRESVDRAARDRIPLRRCRARSRETRARAPRSRGRRRSRAAFRAASGCPSSASACGFASVTSSVGATAMTPLATFLSTAAVRRCASSSAVRLADRSAAISPKRREHGPELEKRTLGEIRARARRRRSRAQRAAALRSDAPACAPCCRSTRAQRARRRPSRTARECRGRGAGDRARARRCVLAPRRRCAVHPLPIGAAR